MTLLTYDYSQAAEYPNFTTACKEAVKFVDGPGYFDYCRIEIQHTGTAWVIKLSEAAYTPRYFAKSVLDSI